jgi:ArsR family transcriptional regulator
MTSFAPADVFRALGDEHRLEILAFLANPDAACCANDDGVCACDIQSKLGLAQATVSYHMKVLQQAGLVNAEKRGRWVYYALRPEGLTVAKELCERYLAAARAAPVL